MRTIFKYPVNLEDMQVIRLPRFSAPLSIQQQGEALQMWALVDTEQPLQDYLLHCYGTGHTVAELPIGHEFISTVQLAGGGLVFHFFGFYA
ncbi:hypothetical protein DNI29_19115 [Hymenobacter sediminis]|uniref:DUF7352 domain-containing protein n=1 Tax=Hymenobacter sediminis TaxID=2218621 RepID=UPI000DA65E9C|nr:hypothetical protein [Hymenobacter sediminis]RPD45493.1 hypothetical protein DNI29_19115 [Hymenobacter sediminis]